MTEDLIQGSEEWHLARLGKVTASRIADLTAQTKSGYSTSRANYMAQLIVERLTGRQTDTFVNDAMRWGTEKEPEACAAYAFMKDADLTEVGFVIHPAIPDAGASPDRYVGADGSLEVKCPITATHIDTLLDGRVPARYVSQMQWQMACSGRAWCDFVSFDPRLPASMQLFVKRVFRDEETIKTLEAEVRAFLQEMDAKLASLRGKYELAV